MHKIINNNFMALFNDFAKNIIILKTPSDDIFYIVDIQVYI